MTNKNLNKYANKLVNAFLKNKIISPKEKETIAFHEAGHATVSWMLEHAAPLVKVTIVPRGTST